MNSYWTTTIEYYDDVEERKQRTHTQSILTREREKKMVRARDRKQPQAKPTEPNISINPWKFR